MKQKTDKSSIKHNNFFVEAINIIIQYSSNELSVLKRKIVTREILFQYLHDNKISVSLPINKHEIISKILDFWNVPSTSESNTSISSSVLNEINQQIRGEVEKAISEDSDRISQLAFQFSEWFYNLLNMNELIDTEHFYPDAKLRLLMTSNDNQDVKEIENDANEIVKTLFQTKMQHNLFFNPNLTKEGIQGTMDPHGLVIVMACGTLHVNNVCVGVFEQVFALARDPFSDNNWKIKTTQLNLKSKTVLGVPSLCDSELLTNSLALDYCKSSN